MVEVTFFFHRQCWYAKNAANMLNGHVEQFLEISLFLTLFPSDLRQNCPAHSPRTVEQYCGQRPNRSENSETSYEVMIEKKLKTEKSRFILKKNRVFRHDQRSFWQNIRRTRRERPKSEPYLRLKNIQGTTIGNIWKNFFFKNFFLKFFFFEKSIF